MVMAPDAYPTIFANLDLLWNLHLAKIHKTGSNDRFVSSGRPWSTQIAIKSEISPKNKLRIKGSKISETSGVIFLPHLEPSMINKRQERKVDASQKTCCNYHKLDECLPYRS
uniref:Uncharacterized protein n=1 Tax=Romanomermis culicivorax TaxID=13658 RepID=A0A915I761_ROMCU